MVCHDPADLENPHGNKQQESILMIIIIILSVMKIIRSKNPQPPGLPDACVAAVHRPRSRGVPPRRPAAGSQTSNHGCATPALRNGYSARVKGDG